MLQETVSHHSPGHAPPRPLPRPDRRDIGLLLLLVAILLAVYSSTLFIPYAYLDDYFWLDQSVNRPGDMYEALAVQGRPLNALILQSVFSHAGGLPGLWRVRLLTVAELAVMGWLFYLAIRWNDWPRWPAFALAVMACTVPAMQVYAAWATSVPIPFSGIAAICAAILVGWSLDDAHRRWPALPAAAGLILVSATIYQPTAMIFWPVAALDLFRRNGDRKIIRRFVVYLLVAMVGLFIAWCVFRHGLATYSRRPSIRRSGTTTDPLGKISWFNHHPLIDSLNLFNLRPNYPVAAAVGLLIIVGLFIYFHGTWRNRILSFAVVLALFPLSYLPNLVAEESWSSYRTQIGLSWLILVLAWMGLDALWSKRWLGARTFCIHNLILFACTMAFRQVFFLIAGPEAFELTDLKANLYPLQLHGVGNIIFLQPWGTNHFAPYSRYDEFGRTSMEGSWVPPSAVNLIVHETNPTAPRIHVECVPFFVGPWTQAVPAGTMLIDMRVIGSAK